MIDLISGILHSVILMMELRLVHEEVTFDKFPISQKELRKRLMYNRLTDRL